MFKRASILVAVVMAFQLHATPELKTVGEGAYRYLFWQLYDARLATVDGVFTDYRQNAPVLLELTYKRDISRQQFIDATVDEWQKLGHSTAEQQQLWALKLQTLWQDVKEGDKLAALLLDDGRVQFYFNGVETGVLDDTAFGAAFFDIWLHPDTSAPKLRRQLIAAQ
ncbi:chalcone isomerase family protein [Rheinheimera maricola]|uniref:Chalcone isomerase family protein n=1 Tax=Rheinheimera maricola TaxID=2793282 RepID=A0ABS7X8R1_9GAMM|nr:chalcone isomerase family protein [Rheinheimera maricola]MBZ9611911.1 chalcone isomerase family protein [Rheinheimera maricola]